MHHSSLLYIYRITLHSHICRSCSFFLIQISSECIMSLSHLNVIYLVLSWGGSVFFFLRYKYASCIKRLKVHSLGTLPFVDQPCLDKYMPFLQDLQIRNRGDLLHAFFLLRLDFVPYQVENKQMLWPCTSTPHFLSFCKEKERHRCSHQCHDRSRLA